MTFSVSTRASHPATAPIARTAPILAIRPARGSGSAACRPSRMAQRRRSAPMGQATMTNNNTSEEPTNTGNRACCAGVCGMKERTVAPIRTTLPSSTCAAIRVEPSVFCHTHGSTITYSSLPTIRCPLSRAVTAVLPIISHGIIQVVNDVRVVM